MLHKKVVTTEWIKALPSTLPAAAILARERTRLLAVRRAAALDSLQKNLK